MANREEMVRRYRADKSLATRPKKTIKKNRKPDRVRPNNWLASLDDDDALEGVAPSGFERIMPLGENERRRANLNRPVFPESPSKVGETVVEIPEREDEPVEDGIVLEVSSRLARVRVSGRTLVCSARGSLGAQETGYTNLVAVGDRVRVRETGPDQGVIEAVMPRRSALARPDVQRSHLQQLLVANVDQLLIVSSWQDPALWPELVDRYLVSAARHNLRPLICVNKIDLAARRAEVDLILAPYRTLGYELLLTSAATGEGIAKLRDRLVQRTTALAGLSGVGKSSLLSAVEPSLDLRTGLVNEQQHLGRHTTTQAILLPLSDGGFVVDTPGIREFGLSGLKADELQRFYPEIAGAARECHYANCAHQGEPGCAVRLAIAAGRVSALRFANFEKIRFSLPA